MQLICILGCRTWPVCCYHSQTFHDSCRADRSSCFKPLGLWDHPSCSGNNWYCLDLFFFFARTQHCMTCYNSLFMLSMRAQSCFGRWSKKRRPRSTATNLPGLPFLAGSLDLRRSKVYHPDIPRDKQAAKPPTARASAPAGRGIVNVHSTMLLLSVLLSSFFLLFFSLLSCL